MGYGEMVAPANVDASFPRRMAVHLETAGINPDGSLARAIYVRCSTFETQRWAFNRSSGSRGAPCILENSGSVSQINNAVGLVAQRSGATSPTATGDRSTPLRHSKAVRELDRRRYCDSSPNSRQSRKLPRTPSSHSQGWVFHMSDVSVFFGIDVSKDTFDVAQFPPGPAPRTFPQSDVGFADFMATLPDPKQCLVALEATGGYESDLVAALAAAGFVVAVVNPRCVRDFAKGIGVLAKTDRIDAAVIARFAHDVKPRPRAEISEKQ